MLKREQLPTEVVALQDLALSLDQRAEYLSHQVEMFKRRLYGPSSEERPEAAGQATLPFADLPAAPVRAEALSHAAVVPKGAEKPQGHGRRKLPAHLYRERFEYHPEEVQKPCPCCGSAWERIGEEISEQVELIPATILVLQHARIKYACPKCRGRIVIGKVPSKILDRGLAGPGLLADLIVKKLYYHLPLYRQEVLTEHLGWTLARSTQSQWLGACAERLEPLYLRAKGEVLNSHKIHTDDTPVRVLTPGAGKTREARFWVYVGDAAHPCTVFDYTPNRKREGPKSFLGDYEGVLQADAYGGYDGIYANGKVTEAGCWAHARRKFDDAALSAPEAAKEALDLIGELYAIEKRARERGLTPEERRALREAHAPPVLERLRAWLERQQAEALPQSPLAKALNYTRAQWAALTRFLSDGTIELDNNTAENALRPIAVGRKNWLFLGNDEGSRRAAILYSLIETCKRHGHDPWAYLKDVLVRIETQPPESLRQLLPDQWKPGRVEPSAAGP